MLGELFESSIAKVLDQVSIVGNMEQTVSMLVESTGLSFKTVWKAVKKLEKLGFITRTRKIGNARAYRFETDRLELLINFSRECG